MFAGTNGATFRICRQTPTTVEYTVTTRPTSLLTPSSIFLILLRIILLTTIFFLLTIKYHTTCEELDPFLRQHLYQRRQELFWQHVQQWSAFGILQDTLGWFCMFITLAIPEPYVVEAVRKLNWLYILVFTVVGGWIASRRGYTEESLLVMRGLGIQTSTTSGSYLSGIQHRFIPTACVQDIFIHEGFRGFEVKFYLFVVVKGEEKVVVIFPKLLPRRKVLEEVWRGSRECLYEPKSS